MKKITENITPLSIIMIIIIILTLKFHNVINQKYISIFSILGSTASILGLVFVSIQILALKRISIVTNETVKQTKSSLIYNISISDVSKYLKTIHEVQNYNRAKKFELSILRLQEIKVFLIQIKNNNEFKEKNIINVKEYQDIVINIGIIINDFEKDLANKKLNIDIVNVNKFLEELSTLLGELETTLKYH